MSQFRFSIILIIIKSLQGCEISEVLHISEDQKFECRKCPQNCQYCSFSLNNKIICNSCSSGFYLENNKCLSCAQNCNECRGQGIEKCVALKKGFFYDIKNLKISECGGKGCQKCISLEECKSCSKGFYEIKQEKGVKCVECQIDNCSYCKQKLNEQKQQMVECTLCTDGYYELNGRCQPCKKNCQYCQKSNGKCYSCQKGYSLIKDKDKCVKEIIPHCVEQDSEGNCIYCENQFFLEKDKKSCIFCSQKLKNCSYCKINADQFKCYSCKIGYYYDQKNNQCLKCGENCLYCRNDEKMKCTQCIQGYFFDSEKCVKNTIEKCKNQKNFEFCYSCLHGFYFDEEKKKCLECDSQCLGCYNKPNQCRSCSISQFTFKKQILKHQKIKAMKDQGLLGGQVYSSQKMPEIYEDKMQIITINSCYSQCPSKFEGKEVFEDFTQKRCFLVSNEKQIDQIQNLVNKDHQSNNYHDQISSIVNNYQTQLYKSLGEQKKNSEFSYQCTFRGKVKMAISGNSDNYQYCQCQPEFMNPNCRIPVILYQETQHQLIELMNKINFKPQNLSNSQKSQIIETLRIGSQIPICFIVIEKIFNFVSQMIMWEQNKSNKKRIIKIIDNILVRLTQLEDQEQQKNFQERDFDILGYKNRELIRDIVKQSMILLWFSLNGQSSQSLIDPNSDRFIQLNTRTFNIHEYQLKSHQLEYRIPNTQLSNYYNRSQGTLITLEVKNQQIFENINFQIVNLDSNLFKEILNQMQYSPISDILYLRFLDTRFPSLDLVPMKLKVKSIKIKFSLLFIPTYENVKDHIKCLAFSKDKKLNPVIGKIKGEQESILNQEEKNEEDFFTCEFGTYFPIFKYYLVLVESNQIKKNHH